MRVAITTTADRQVRLAGLISTMGMEPVAMPCIQITPAGDEVLERARSAAAAADVVAVTSPRTVRVVWPTAMPSTQVWAVGTATARAVRKVGGEVGHIGEGGAARMILSAPPSRSLRVFFPHAAETPGDVIDLLAGRVGAFHHIVVYETEHVRPGKDAVDAALFLSPSAVNGWLSVRSLDGLAVAALGETTTTALRDHGVEPDVVPPTPDIVNLIQQLAQLDARESL